MNFGHRADDASIITQREKSTVQSQGEAKGSLNVTFILIRIDKNGTNQASFAQ
jgi:hypothetical protein